MTVKDLLLRIDEERFMYPDIDTFEVFIETDWGKAWGTRVEVVDGIHYLVID